MQNKNWLIGLTLIALCGSTACAGSAYASNQPNQMSTTNPERGFVKSVQTAVQSTWDFGGAVGESITQFGQTAPNCLGFLTCLVLPLAWLGAWTLSNLPRILGLMTFRNNLRSFFRD
jgi:hypothetical protein